MSLRHRKKDANTKIDGNEKRGRNKDEKEEKPEKKDTEVNIIRKCAVHVACQSSFRDVGDMASGVTQV